MNERLGKLKCLLLVPVVVLIIALAIPFLIAMAAVWSWRSCAIRWRLRRTWPSGTWILLSYTQSAVWAPYLESRVIPRLGAACVAIDRSQPDWKVQYPAEARAIAHWGGYREYNPLVVLFPKWQPAITLRLFAAFRDKKHGKDGPLEAEVNRLFSLVDEHAPPEHRA